VHVAAVMPAAAAEVVRHKLEGAGWAETEAPDVEQAWVLQVILEHTRAQVWQHAQTRILEMLSMCTLSKSRLEEFARIAAASDMFIHFGETLTGRTASLRQVKTNCKFSKVRCVVILHSRSGSELTFENFSQPLSVVCQKYSAVHHSTQLATLQTALESDFWRPYPCGLHFNLSSIHELGPFLPNAAALLHTTIANLRPPPPPPPPTNHPHPH